MSRELVIAWIGRRRPAWDGLCADYEHRIQKVAPIRDVLIKPGSGPDAVRIEQEGRALLSSLPVPVLIVALDRRGTTTTSLELSKRLATTREEWPHPVAFVIGSDLGLSREVLEASRWRLSLGQMTLPHELARLVLYEQVYRALAIERGIKYHRLPLDGH